MHRRRTNPSLFEGEQIGATGGGEVAVLDAPNGYIDDAIPHNMFRVRYDRGINMNQPDRGEYFYAAWNEIGFHLHQVLRQPTAEPFQTTTAKGIDALPGRVDFDQVSPYLELRAATGRRYSLKSRSA